MNFLVDHNLRGHSIVLTGSLAASGWLDLSSIRFVYQMILITANRSMKGKDSLEQVMREENTHLSLPVVTIGNIDRLLAEPDYRDRCVNRLVDIVVDIEDYQGARRIFIP